MPKPLEVAGRLTASPFTGARLSKRTVSISGCPIFANALLHEPVLYHHVIICGHIEVGKIRGNCTCNHPQLCQRSSHGSDPQLFELIHPHILVPAVTNAAGGFAIECFLSQFHHIIYSAIVIHFFVEHSISLIHCKLSRRMRAAIPLCNCPEMEDICNSRLPFRNSFSFFSHDFSWAD